MSEVSVAIDLSTDGAALEGNATLHGVGEPIAVEAHAMRHLDGSIDDWARDLVTARLLRRLEVALMESVHERIDRAVMNE